MTLKDIKEILSQMLRSSNDELQDHAMTLVGPRTRGSTTDADWTLLPEDLELELVETQPAPELSNLGPVKVYWLPAPTDSKEWKQMNPRVKVITLGDALKLKCCNVLVRDGAHGPELVLKPHPCTDLEWEDGNVAEGLTFIVGPDAGVSPKEDVIHTWFPGPAYERVSLPLGAAVKIS